MFILILIIVIGVLLASVAVFSLTFIPNKWIRGLILLCVVSFASYFSFHAGIMDEWHRIAGAYNRPLSLAYYAIVDEIEAGQHEKAKHIAQEMKTLTYIAPPKWRKKNVAQIYELLKY